VESLTDMNFEKGVALQTYESLMSGDIDEASAKVAGLKPLGEFEVTYYTASPAEGTADRITATGTAVKAGRTIAVDPKVIPYGTTIFIEGLGYRVAEDCGAAVKGKSIDVYVEDPGDIPDVGRHKASVYM
jgi:3D (Asp-Asp-Asp) domain-containing protein